MTIGIFGQFKYRISHHLRLILKAFEERNIFPLVEEEFHSSISEDFIKKYKTFKLQKSEVSKLDLFLSMGGDGSILRAANYVNDSNVPIVGINMGRLGFLSTIQQEDIKNLIDAIINEKLKIVERSILQIKGVFIKEPFALNEVCVNRKDTASMITIETYLDNEFLTSYWADGLIVSTPTGSTGYSLSCGGPVITPCTNIVALTPIAPHNLNARPLIISNSTKIKLSVNGREKNHLLSLDSRTISIPNGTEITIEKASFSINMAELNTESFFKTLRKKLLWGEDKRN